MLEYKNGKCNCPSEKIHIIIGNQAYVDGGATKAKNNICPHCNTKIVPIKKA